MVRATEARTALLSKQRGQTTCWCHSSQRCKFGVSTTGSFQETSKYIDYTRWNLDIMDTLRPTKLSAIITLVKNGDFLTSCISPHLVQSHTFLTYIRL